MPQSISLKTRQGIASGIGGVLSAAAAFCLEGAIALQKLLQIEGSFVLD
ncbi:MAG: hypothetical protein ICV62_12810 [Cyanobacteria bacterium Co-bin13]|nr:hypothetical protein [Cyanobacteria bacterium Co-bin13]